jgi:hypothetical protein
MLLLLSCIAGILLGLYFNVLVLLPVCFIGSVIFILAHLSSGLSFSTTLGSLLFPFISVQAGYMLGLTGRDTFDHILARFQALQSNRI